jgi:hypothetical protein
MWTLAYCFACSFTTLPSNLHRRTTEPRHLLSHFGIATYGKSWRYLYLEVRVSGTVTCKPAVESYDPITVSYWIMFVLSVGKRNLQVIVMIQRQSYPRSSLGSMARCRTYLVSIMTLKLCIQSFSICCFCLGYHAAGPALTLAAICAPLTLSQEPLIQDLASANLRLKRDRIVNLRRLINLCKYIHPLVRLIGYRDAPEFDVIDRYNLSLVL